MIIFLIRARGRAIWASQRDGHFKIFKWKSSQKYLEMYVNQSPEMMIICSLKNDSAESFKNDSFS